MSCLGCAGRGKSFLFSLDVISLKVAIAVQFNCLMLLNQERISMNLAILTWSPPVISTKSVFSLPAISTKSAFSSPVICSSIEVLAWMEEGGGMWKRRRAKLRPREGGEGEGGDVAVVMAMCEGKDDGGGGSAFDERGGA